MLPMGKQSEVTLPREGVGFVLTPWEWGLKLYVKHRLRCMCLKFVVIVTEVKS